MADEKSVALKEIHESLSLCNYATTKIGLTFIDELPKTFAMKLVHISWVITAIFLLSGLVSAEVVYVSSLLLGSSSVAEFVASLHIVGYGSMSLFKLLTLYAKRKAFRKIVVDLAEIWPVNITDPEAVSIKDKKIAALRFGQYWYMAFTQLAMVFYSVTPIGLYLYRLARGTPAPFGFIWYAKYPFDKTEPITHGFVYIFEIFSGSVSVCAMLGSDTLFTAMASFLSILLELLQVKVRNLGQILERGPVTIVDSYDEIVSIIKTHQKIIRFKDELEDIFGMVNLVNVVLSSINICCAVFNVVLIEPWLDMGNKFFIGSILSQVGIVCWYADYVYRTSTGISDAVYASGWYNCNTRCQRALLLLMQRSQKPLCFTALKFSEITMRSFSSILTSSYSYFTLLATSYRSNN